ncbi:DUF1853 family protein [Flavivirga rizhaonensis]|uniref:DUF1853 family protein n=1 Tax=Flavivirga rizhaonensis TaxID=2559571 RepID=A0A4V3P4V1_9FLAO|nr:DUF1853 family protein [Flavivirga rizhaonensis]TGV02834.1 DUF1853 family protein [Flavivirga rizhaonensis]
MIQKRYEGFLNTPFLWKGDILSNLNSFKITSKSNKIDINIDEKLCLGKYVERFVSFELEQHKNISILAENIQIQDNKITLGELDCLLLKNNKPIHLEVVYKFYVYDTSIGKTEIEHFIGPNRKDSLKEKITKLKDKQLPLLHSNTCRNYLKALNLKSEDIAQQVYFKAQLFVPISNQDIQLKTLNNDCISGFYINKNKLDQFNDCKFYIPKKKDWLIIPHTNVKWLNFNEFEVVAKDYFEQQFSPLCWVKLKNGALKKIFLVWW